MTIMQLKSFKDQYLDGLPQHNSLIKMIDDE